MMGPVTHFLIGMLCGTAIGGVAVAFRRRLLIWLPAFVLACGFWAEVPCLAGAPDTTHWLSNVFFGYAWLHQGQASREFVAFFFVLGIANLLLLGHMVFLSRYFGTVDMIRWEERGPERRGRRSKRRHSHSSRHRSQE